MPHYLLLSGPTRWLWTFTEIFVADVCMLHALAALPTLGKRGYRNDRVLRVCRNRSGRIGEEKNLWSLSCFGVEYIYGFVRWGVCKQSRWRHSVPRAVTRWRICVTMATLWQQQDGGYALLFYIFNSTEYKEWVKVKHNYIIIIM